jgi:hypothetical protein
VEIIEKSNPDWKNLYDERDQEVNPKNAVRFKKSKKKFSFCIRIIGFADKQFQ